MKDNNKKRSRMRSALVVQYKKKEERSEKDRESENRTKEKYMRNCNTRQHERKRESAEQSTHREQKDEKRSAQRVKRQAENNLLQTKRKREGKGRRKRLLKVFGVYSLVSA